MVANIGQVTYSSPVDFQISPKPPEGLPANLQGVFEELYNYAQRNIQALVDYCGIGPQAPSLWDLLAGSSQTILRQNLGRFYVVASEAIAFGAMIHIFNSAGIANVRNANATNNTKPCRGYCSTPGGIAAGTVGEIILGAGVATVGGVTPGASYYLSTANGLLAAAPAAAAGNIEQFLGFGLTGNSVLILPHYWIQH